MDKIMCTQILERSVQCIVLLDLVFLCLFLLFLGRRTCAPSDPPIYVGGASLPHTPLKVGLRPLSFIGCLIVLNNSRIGRLEADLKGGVGWRSPHS